MALSEIEVVSSPPASSPAPAPAAPPGFAVLDVFSAAAYGDFEKLRWFVEREGASVAAPDASGYHAVQWAALNNFPDIVQYIVEHGGNVNATDHMQQTALHWAAVRGGIAVADVLLQNGARVEASDINGYRSVHVAAQYGQTAFLNHIVAKYHADFDVPDNEGRTPLHWAAYKGFADTIRLLLFRDASQSKQDKEGCTPLHWAVMKGNVEASTVLVHAGTKQELTVQDNAGFTPVQLASDKGHRNIAFLLANVQKAQRGWCKDKQCGGRNLNNSYAAILLCIIVILMILFMNSILAAPNLTKVTAVVGLWGWTAVSLAIVALIMFYRCTSKEPGYIKRPEDVGGSIDTEGPLLNIDTNSSSEWTGNWSQLCPTCKIIRPVRAKHCPTCNRCVEQFDHHCPWISNCVGKRNKRDFFILICTATLASLISVVVAIQRIWTAIPLLPVGETWIHSVIVQHPGAVTFLLADIIVFVVVTALTTAQASQIARNITTNELANALRYGYLRGPDGKYRNPYNHGCWKNCSDFLIRGYTDDEEIAWPPLQQVAS